MRALFGTPRGERLPTAVFYASLACVIAYVAWLPVFPSGDGPAHLYFASVLRGLIDRLPEYRTFYAVRHLVAPYALHYLALIGLERFVTDAVAEKIFVAAIVTNFALGARFLARRLARAAGRPVANASVASLFIIPLLLDWSLGAGFFNFCFAVGTLFWALGLYTLQPSAVAFVGFVLMLIVLVFSHPVPLIILILFIAADLLLLVWQRPGWGVLAAKAAALAWACVAMVGPLSIADKGNTGVAAILPDVRPHWDVLQALVTGANLGLISGTAPLEIIAQAALVLTLPCAVWLVGRKLFSRVRHNRVSAADRLMLIATIFLATTWFFPHSLNGSYFFPERMWDIVWPLVIATAAGAQLSGVTRRWLTWTAIVLIAVTFTITFPVLANVAERQAALGAAPLPDRAQGIYIEPSSVVDQWNAGTTYPLYYWAGVRAFAPHRDVLLNSPWMYLTILPVEQSRPGALFYDTLPTDDSEHPFALWQQLRGDSAYRDEALARAGFILYANPLAADPHPLEEMKPLLREQQPLWNCTASDFYAVCVKKAPWALR